MSINHWYDGNWYIYAEYHGSFSGNAYGGISQANLGTTATGTWYHMVVVYDGTATGNANRLKIYLNGVQKTFDSFSGTIASTISYGDHPTYIGRPSYGSTYQKNFNGKIDEVTIWKRALTDDEVLGLYNGGEGATPNTAKSGFESKPTNVQVGSRWEETDTRKMYHYGGAGTVALNGTPQTTSGSTNTSLSVSINVGDFKNKALICCVYQQSGSTTSIKVGNNSFTNMVITNGSVTGTGSQRAEIWYLLDADITNNASNQIDWVGSAGSRCGIGVYSLYNVNQGGGADTFISSQAYNTSSGYSNQPNGVVNSVVSGDFILDQLSANCTTVPTDTLTEGWNEQINNNNRYSVSQYNASPSTNNNMFYSNVDAAEWAWSGVRIKQSTNTWSELGT